MRWTGSASIVSVLLAAFAFGLHKIDDFDTWWHLAAGRWIAAHHAVPATDTLSHTVRDHVWTNVQWLFDATMYAAYSTGGSTLLCILGALVFLTTAALLMRLASRDIGPGLGGLLVLLAIVIAQTRVTLRPELASFLLLAAVLSVLDHGRRHAGRGLWILVPLMLLWANVHALFVIGIFAIVCAVISSGRQQSQPLLRWGALAILIVIANPYGLNGVWFPIKLLSRINGSSEVFQTIGEFSSPFSAPMSSSMAGYGVILALAAVSAVAAVIRSRRFDVGAWLFVGGLAAVSVGTRRNVALFAVGATPFIAQWLAAARVRTGTWTPWASAVSAAAALAVTAAVMSGAIYRYDNSPQEFGTGVIDATFPIRAAAFAKAAQLPGKLYNDMSAGGYLSWDDPIGDGVFIDGRLEVYDAEFVGNYVAAEGSASRWDADADKFNIQTVMLFHRFENERVLAGRLRNNRAWTMVYVDETAVIFVRSAGNVEALARAANLRPDWDAKTRAWLDEMPSARPYRAGRIEGLRAYARLQATIGGADAAIDAYKKLVTFNLLPAQEIDARLLLGRYFTSHKRTAEAQEQARAILALDPNNAEAAAWR